MRTLELNSNYDIFILLNGNLAVQRDDLSVIRQTIVNKLSLVKGEDIYDNQHGLNLDIIFGNDIPYSEKMAEIKRVILLDKNVVSVDNIQMEADKTLRIGHFTCYITVAVSGENVQTSIGFGI